MLQSAQAQSVKSIQPLAAARKNNTDREESSVCLLGKRTTSNRRINRPEPEEDIDDSRERMEQESYRKEPQSKYRDEDPDVTSGRLLVKTMIWHKVLSTQTAFENRFGPLVTSVPGRFDPCKSSDEN